MDARHLESRISTLRARVRRLLALHGLSRVVACTVPLVVLACLADWLAHFDAGVRLALLVALGGFTAWLAYRHVVLPLVVRFADLDIALRIEERWPGLNDRLASTIQFLKLRNVDDRFGSPELREATVKQTLEEANSIDFRAVVQPKPVYQALAIAAAALLFAGGFVLAEPALSKLAARRLFMPFGGEQWPQMTHLALLDKETPRKIARGEPFTLAVAVVKGDRIPSSARATYRFENGETQTESLRAVEGGVFRGRMETVEQSFKFSVSAGDDAQSVRDIPVRVVPPPAVKDLSVRLVPPTYTKLEPQTLAAGRTQIKAVAGTRVELLATASKPLASAALRLGENAPPVAGTLDAAKTRVQVAFTLKGSNSFWFELLDGEGFKNREAERYEARAIADEAPRVMIDDPANDRDVPANAVVPVIFTVDDDYGIHSARLVYKAASGGSEPTRDVILPLWDSSETPGGKPVLHQQVRYTWDLAPLKLPAGSVLTFHADARDFDTIKGPNLGRSREIRLRIVSDQEIATQLDDARRAIREDVEGILQMQNQARTPVDEAARMLSKTEKVSSTLRENLKNAEMIQRQVSTRVTNKADGLQEKVDRFLEDLKNFKVDSPDARKQMEQMRDAVGRIRENHLDPAEQGLTRSTKNLGEAAGDEPKKPEKATAPEDSRAGAKPESDESKSQAAKSSSSKNEAGKSDASKSAASKSAASKEAAGKSEASNKSAGKSDASKSAAGKSDASKEAAGKSEASKSAGDAASKQASDAAKSSKPSPSSSSPDKNQAGKRPVDAAKEALAESQTNQKAIADELKQMLDGLSEFENVRSAVKDAQNLLKEHEQVMKQTNEAAGKPDMMGKTPDQLTPEQKADLANLAVRQANVARETRNLQEKLGQMAKRMEGSDPMTAAGLTEAAEQLGKRGTAGKAGEAAEQLEKNQMGSARGNQEQAREDLKDLVDAIQNRRERELSRLVRDLKQAESDLAKLRQRQTQNLEKTRAAQKNQDAKQRENDLKQLAKEQAEIKKELDRQLKKLAKLNAESAAKAGARAASKMGQAQEKLDQGQGEQADQNEEEALADLEDAQDKVNQKRKEAEEELAMEQFSKMGDRLRSLSEREEKIAADTAGYEQLRVQRAGKLTIAQRTGIRNLAGVQEGLKDETAELIERLEGAPVFALTLKRASDGMSTAASRLQELKTDDPTQRAARAASGRFKQLLDALKPDRPKNAGQQGGKGDENNDGGGGGGANGGGDGIPPAAQLKMLKSLQQEINERTEYFDELKRRGKELSPDQTAELDKLENDQGSLADLVRDLTRPKSDDGED